MTDSTREKAAVDAHYGMEMTWDFYKNVLGRNSIDGNGMALNSYVHLDNKYDNAFWDGQAMQYGDGDGILTAIPPEYQAVRQVAEGAWEGSEWEDKRGPHGLPVAFRTYRTRGGKALRVALAQSPDIGAVEAMQTLLPLVEAYRPSCIAMAGVCAGRRGKTRLGDVIAADRLFFYDTGKQLPRQRSARHQNLQPAQ